MRLTVLLRAALIGGVAATLAFSAGIAADAADKPKKQKPRQVHPTGAEDAAPPTDAELAAEKELEEMTNRSSEGLRVITLQDGTQAVDLVGRFMHVSRIVTAADGSQKTICTTHGKTEAKTPPAAKPAPAAAPKKAPAALEEK